MYLTVLLRTLSTRLIPFQSPQRRLSVMQNTDWFGGNVIKSTNLPPKCSPYVNLPYSHPQNFLWTLGHHKSLRPLGLDLFLPPNFEQFLSFRFSYPKLPPPNYLPQFFCKLNIDVRN